MLHVNLFEAEGIAVLEPDGELSAGDFGAAAGVIDPYIEKHGKLNGLVIHVSSFPGWDSFAALVTHLKFVRQHHRQVTRVAFATDSAIAGFAENIASHFVNAELKGFAFDELEAAKSWVQGGAEH